MKGTKKSIFELEKLEVRFGHRRHNNSCYGINIYYNIWWSDKIEL